ncbi:extracellular solute-binding protein [Nonomuraea salmonea]
MGQDHRRQRRRHPPAQDIHQQLGQALAGSNPPDVFYVDAARFADYASVGALEPYADKISDSADFYPSLRETFTYDGRFTCVPKDFSTLALIVNDDLWKKNGLTEDDIPATWDELTAVAKKIKGVTPLTFSDTRDRVGAFMVQAGGWITDGEQATGDSPENLKALEYVKGLLTGEQAQYAKALDAEWGGEAFGKGKAAMTIEGNWIKGAMQADYPGVAFSVHELPAGPEGKGTLSFSNCWGIAAKSRNKAAAISFVEAMTKTDQQLAFAKAFGVMPSRASAKDAYLKEFPGDAAFVNGADYAQGPVNAPQDGQCPVRLRREPAAAGHQGPEGHPGPAAEEHAERAGLTAMRSRTRENLAGWLFVAPVVVILGLFLLLPILMALWVSLTGWNGQGSPFRAGVPFVGTDNYARLFTEDGLAREDFMTSIRNNLYYVAAVVPLQTALALFLALVVNKRRTFFRTAFYFPSVTSSVAISVVFLFIFSNSGAVNQLLAFLGIDGPQWFSDPRGVIQLLVGDPPAALTEHGLLGLTWWDWLSGPSVAMCAIIVLVVWTTSGTFMLMFLAALQNIPRTLDEAAMIDGATRAQRFWRVTLPMLKPAMFLVLTLGLIGTWQVFDQIYVMSQGDPAKTTLTPAFLSYRTAFRDFDYGAGTAISFVLFLIIVLLTLFQRWVMRERKA